MVLLLKKMVKKGFGKLGRGVSRAMGVSLEMERLWGNMMFTKGKG